VTTLSAGLSVSGELAPATALSPARRAAMFSLLDRHFQGVTRPQFEQDLAAKNWVLLLRSTERDGQIVGFSTMAVYEAAPAGSEKLNILCSGDTIVDPCAWGSAALPREWIAAVRRLRIQSTPNPWYWLLITSGLRTYRLLPTFWRDFWPRPQAATPAPMERLLNALAAEHFGERFNAATGIVTFERPQVLRSHLADSARGRARDDPYAEFFFRRNPGHTRGDELVCICELNDANLTRAGQRVTFGRSGGPPS
jgi:hypothetical protein